MIEKTLAELSQSLALGEFSSEELTQAYIQRIKEQDGQYNSYITVTESVALQQAKAADKILKHKRGNGEANVMTGIPLAHKDIFCTEGIKTSAGSKMLDNFISPYDATVIARFKQAGTVTLGKTNMDEFAMGSSTENSYYGATKNPWDSSRVPGGSSGGSAVVVAAGLAPAATGTDTGGSIRQPAALCGITGLKPSYGRVSRWGMIAYASSLEQAGPMTKTAEDAAIMLNIMAGVDSKDSTSIDHPVEDYRAQLNQPLKGLRIGLPRQHFSQGLDGEVQKALEAAIKAFEKLGASIKEINLDTSPLSISAYYVIASAEASTNLSRYDGVRYGYRCKDPLDLEDMYKRSRSEGFGEEVKRRIMVGTYALSTGYYDAYYLKAQKIRRLIKQDYEQAFKEVDVIVGPTTPNIAFKLGSKTNDPVTMYLEDIYTIAVNLAGLPAISIPAGMSQGLPIGLQIVGNYFQESRILNVAHQFQQHTDWHQRRANPCAYGKE